ncbi:MAG TPA: DUF420 domain-containing protein [Anaerolineae bacterium]
MQHPSTPKPAKPLISPLGWIGIVLFLVAAFILLQLSNSFQLKAPIPGTRIPLGAGLNAVAQVGMIIALLFGWRFARARNFRRHRRTQTTVVLINWLAILFIMGVTFFGPEVTGNPKSTSDPIVLAEIAHGIVGGLTALSGGYLVFRMVFERALPAWIKVKNFKRMMQITIVVWLLVALGGLGIFAMKYLLPSSAATVAQVPTPAIAPPAPTATPTTEPTSIPPSPTPAEVTGIAAVVDANAFSDRLNIELFNVPPVPFDAPYSGWLVGNDGEFRLNVGTLQVGPDGRVKESFTSPLGENLLANYDEFIVAHDAGDELTPTSHIPFSAVVPKGARPALRALLVSVSDTPENAGYLVGLRQQAELVSEHVSLTDLALGTQDIEGIHRHAEHLINILEGLHGRHFGDVDGDGRVLNPGDGYGLLSTASGPGYVESVVQHAQTALEAPDATEQVKLHAQHVLIGAKNAGPWADQLDEKALELASVQDIATAQALLAEMRDLADKLLNGVDANGNGTIEPIEGEGTVYLAYVHAQFAASPAYDVPFQEGGAPVVVAQATPTPTPLPPAATPTSAPQVVQVLMQDFTFSPATITIKAGTTVEFINLDNAPHTATLDDNSLDTGTLNLNDRVTLKFDTPGEFSYFCLFHGGPGGVGMAAKIIVEP